MIIIWGYSSDRRGERYRHVAFAWLIVAWRRRAANQCGWL